MNALHVHRLDPQQDEYFIAQEREDPVTGEFLEAGDEVVVCAGCQSAFLRESWEYLGGQHCRQHRTLPAIPEVKSLKIKRNKKRFVIGNFTMERPAPWRRIMAFAADLLIAFVASVFIFLPMAGLYFWFRDALDGGRSVGKAWLKLRTVDTTTGAACTWSQSFRRNLLPGLFLSYGHILVYAMLITQGSSTLLTFLAVIGGLVFILTAIFVLVRFLTILADNEDSLLSQTRVVRE